jgi:hypothetical protein
VFVCHHESSSSFLLLKIAVFLVDYCMLLCLVTRPTRFYFILIFLSSCVWPFFLPFVPLCFFARLSCVLLPIKICTKTPILNYLCSVGVHRDASCDASRCIFLFCYSVVPGP